MNDELLFILKMRDEASAALKAATGSVRGLGTAAKQAEGGVSSFNKETSKTVATSKTAALSVGNFAAVLAAAYTGLRAVSASGSFDRSMTQITSLVGISTEQVSKWRKELLATSAEFGKTPQEMAEGLYFITSSGISAGKAMEVLQTAAKASATGMGSVATISDALTSALGAYGEANLSAADAVGQMTAGIKVGKIEADQLAQVLGQVIPNAAEAGVEFHEVNAALAGMSLVGIDAARGATIMRQTLQDVIAPSKQAIEALDKVGLSAKIMQDTFRNEGYLAGLQLLRDKLGTGLEFRKVVNDAEALSGMLALTGKNAEQVTEIFKALAQAGEGDLTKAFEAAAESGAFKLDQGLALIQTGLITLGDAVMPMVISAINSLLQVWKYFFDGTVEANNRLLLLKGAMYLVVGAFTAWATVMAAMKIQAFLTIIGGLATAGYTLAMSFASVAIQSGVASAAMGVFRTALISTGIGAIVVLIGTLIAALVYLGSKSYEVSGTIASGWQIIGASFQAVVAFVKSLAADLVSVIQDNMGAITAILASTPAGWPILIIAYWDEIVAGTASAWDKVSSYVSENIDEMAYSLPTIGPAVAQLVAMWEWLKTQTIISWDGVYEGVRITINKLIDLIPGLRTTIDYVIKLGNAMADAYNRASGAAGKAFDKSVGGGDSKPFFNDDQRAAAKDAREAYEARKAQTKLPPVPAGGGTGGTAGRKGGGGGAAKADPFGDAMNNSKTRLADLKAEITLEQQLADIVVRSASSRAILTEELKAQFEAEKPIRKLRSEGKINSEQEAELLAQAKEYARERGRLAATKYDGDQAEKNFEASRSLDVLTSQTSKYVEAAKLDKDVRVERIAYLDAETAALQRGASVEQAALEGMSAAATARQGYARDVAEAQASMMEGIEQEMELLEQLAPLQNESGDAAEVHRAYIVALAEAHRAGIPDAEAYAQAVANLKQKQIEAANVPETAGQGFRRWMQDMRDNALSTGQMVYSALNSTFDALGTAFGRLVTGQKVGWKSLLREMAVGIASMIAKALVWMAITKLIALIPGGAAILAALDSMANAQTAIGGAIQGAKVAGVVSKGSSASAGLRAADGAAFGDGIIRAPTYFQYNGKGGPKTGLMGEAGPEAIMPLANGGSAIYAYVGGKIIPLPLSRGPNGKLGVTLDGDKFARGGKFGNAQKASELTALSRISQAAGGLATSNQSSQEVTFNLGDTHIQFVGSGNAEQDRESAEMVAKMVDSAVEEKVGKVWRRMQKEGGANNMGLGRAG